MYKTLEAAAQEVSVLEYAVRSIEDLRAKKVLLRICNEKAHQAHRIAKEHLDLVAQDLYSIRQEIKTTEHQFVSHRKTIQNRIADRGVMSSEPLAGKPDRPVVYHKGTPIVYPVPCK